MNKLAAETSPYLLQHADNPVDWYPWGPEALERANREGKPILLSIGYSACHWCHVMAHESFEDPETAELMNRLFVNIKVDREERPDLDKIYQATHQLIHRRPGGWPLTMFLNAADQRPYFGGTYFPKTPRPGLPAFGELLQKAADYYEQQPKEIREHGAAIVEALEHLEPGEPAPGEALSNEPLAVARESLGQQFDAEYGGFGNAPKFPHPTNLDRLLRHWRATAHGSEPDTQALFICALTLTRMAEGGIYDQLGGGFCRYSVDQAWSIPHFEKMLYDNGLLLALYAQFWLVSGEDLYRRIAEGRFYVWTPDEVRELLSEPEFRIVAAGFGLDDAANFDEMSFDDGHSGGTDSTGQWHLRVTTSIESIAESSGQNESSVRRVLDEARAKLLQARNQRVWPGRDEKILTSWNALMIRGLAIAARALCREELATAAAASIDFVRRHLVREGRLFAVYKDGRARFSACLDDYAYLLDATIELLQARWNSEHLTFAVWLADQLLDNFQDDERGGFYFTRNDHETLIHRTRPMSDDALPSGNGIAALGLNRLGYLLGEPRYLAATERTLLAGWNTMEAFPHGHTTLLTALEEFLDPPEVIILRGRQVKLDDWHQMLDTVYAPRRLVIAIPDTETNLPGALAARKPEDNTVAYVCRGKSCSAPITSFEELTTQLAEH